MAYDERLLTLALAAANIGTWHWDVCTNHVTWSDNIESMFGLQKGQFDGTYTAFLALLSEQDKQRLSAAIERSLADDVPYEIEHQLTWPNGEVHWFLGKGKVIRDANGKPVEMLGTTQDITQEKLVTQIMDNLARAVPYNKFDEFLQHTIRQLAQFYQCRYAFVGRLLEDKKHVRTMVVWAGDRIVENFTYALHGTPCQDILDLKAEMIPRDAWRLYPEDIMLKDMGVESYFGAPMTSSHGELLGLVSVMDIAPMGVSRRRSSVLAAHATRLANEIERANTLKEIHEQGTRLHQAINLAQMGVWEWDIKTDRTVWSEKMFDIYGVSPAEFSGKGSDYIAATRVDYREQQQENIKQAFANGITDIDLLSGKKLKPNPKELVITRPDGTEVMTLGDAVVLLDEQGLPDRMIGITMDITEKKRAENELMQYKQHLEQLIKERTYKLEAINQELEAFAYSVSHDLRGPLRAVDGFSQILAEDYASQLDTTGKDYLRRLCAAASHMNELIDAMLNLSRLSRSELHVNEFNISRCAHDILDQFAKENCDRHVHVSITPDMVVKGDAAMLQILLQNLLSNAWKYTRKIPETRIEIGMETKSDASVYYVRDNGAGFDMNYANKLFGAFQRLHRADEFEGIGIGLATAKRIVSRHGGQIWAVGQVDKGATFYFTL